ncbi:MAG: hypothetical protein U0269_29900 [Polyangiales bacterium]
MNRVRTAAALLSLTTACAGAPPVGDASSDQSSPMDSAADHGMIGEDVVGTDAAVVQDASADSAACPSGQARCGGECVDTQSSASHCGACGAACSPMQSCVMGMCQCPGAGEQLCSGACVDTRTSVVHCGRCNNACPGGQMCVAGTCRVDCALPNMLCTSGGMTVCDDLSTSVANCGTCGNACPAGANMTPRCNLGACSPGTCNAGFADCDANSATGCEVNTTNTVAHCGACRNACPTPPNAVATCAASTCGMGACNAGFDNCDGNAANGCEVNIRTSATHCGRCGNSCPGLANAIAGCVAGTCGIGACNVGFDNCDGNVANGCETPTSANAMNCGRCGNVCAPGQTCVAGTCATPTVFANTVGIPAVITGSAGCSMLLDTNADQLSVTDDDAVFVILRCAPGLMITRSIDGARTWSPLRLVAPTPTAATVRARSRNDVMVLLANGAAVDFTRSTDGGVSFPTMTRVASGFGSSGPGPALTITENGGSLYVTFSTMSTMGTIWRSTTLGSTWTAFGAVTYSGTNYCPDLFGFGASDLLVANEVDRQVFRSSTTLPSWAQIGVVSAMRSGFSDFAFGGTTMYATGAQSTIERATVSPMSVSANGSVNITASNNERSMDADAAGNLAFAVTAGSGAQVFNWRPSAPAIDGPVMFSTPAAATMVATGAIRTTRGSVTVVMTANGAYPFVRLFP